MSHRDAQGDVLYGADNYRSHLRAAREGDFAHAHNDREEHLKRVIDRLEDAHNQMNAELTSTKLALSNARDELEKLRKTVAEAKNKEQEQCEYELTTVREAVRVQVEEQKTKSIKLSERLDGYEQELDRRDSEVNARDARIRELERKNSELERELDSKTAHVDDLKADLGAAKGERDDHITKYRQHQEDAQKMGRDLQSRDGELQNLRDEQRNMKQKLDSANDRVVELERVNKEVKSAMETQKVSHEHSLHLLKQELHQTQHRLQETSLHTERLDGDAAMKEKTQRELLDELKDKDEVIFKQHAVVVEQQRREQELQDEYLALLKALRERTDELRTLDDTLLSQTDRINSRTAGEPFGVSDPYKLLVQCTPIGVPVVRGREVQILITTVNSKGVPVRGESALEFAINVADVDVGHPEICFPKRSDVSSESPQRPRSPRSPPGSGLSAGSRSRASPPRNPEGTRLLRDSSTFAKSYYANQEGWTPVIVTYKGQTVQTGFFCYGSEEEAAQQARDERERALLSVARKASGGNSVSVSIRPSSVLPGDEAEAVIVVRDNEGRPLVGGTDLSSAIAVSEMLSASCKAVPSSLLGPVSRVDGSGVYVAPLRVPEEEFEWVGVLASFEGATGAGCCHRNQGGTRKVVPRNSTVVCAPDPVAAGDTVTAVLTTRSADMEPIPLEDAQDILFSVKPTGSGDRISPITALPGGNGSQWVCTFQAGKAGRAGVQFEYAGSHLGGGSVEVLVPSLPDPSKTEVIVTPASAAPGQQARAIIRTRDSSGRLATGPQPSQLQVSSTGAARGVRETPQRGHVDGEYISEFHIADDAYTGDTAVIEVTYQGQRSSDGLTVAQEQGAIDDEARRRVDPPIRGGFLRDPAIAGRTVDLLIEVDPSSPAPTVIPITNVGTVGMPHRVPHNPGVYICSVYVLTAGTASVSVSSNTKRAQLSTTVVDSPLAALLAEIGRLRTVSIKLKQYGLLPMPAKKPSPSPKRPPSPRSPRKAEVMMHPRFGIEMVASALKAKSKAARLGAASAGEHLDQERATVVKVKPGPCEGKLAEGDVITGIREVGAQTTDVLTKHDFDKFREQLGRVKEGESFPRLEIFFDAVAGGESSFEMTPEAVADRVSGKYTRGRNVRREISPARGGSVGRSPPPTGRNSPSVSPRKKQDDLLKWGKKQHGRVAGAYKDLA